MTGNGVNNSPWWSKTIWQTGPVVAGFVVMLGMLIGWIPSPLLRLPQIEKNQDVLLSDHASQRLAHEAIVANQSSAQGQLSDISVKLNELIRAGERQSRLLLRICGNTAKNDLARDACER